MCRLSRSNIVQITACGCFNIICPYLTRYSFYTILLDYSTIAHYNDSPYNLTITTTVKICTSTSAHLHSLIRSITVVPKCSDYRTMKLIPIPVFCKFANTLYCFFLHELLPLYHFYFNSFLKY